MNKNFYNQIANCSALRKSRENNKNYILSNPEFLPDLIQIALNPTDQNHYKAFWILELVCEEHPELFIPYIEKFCQTIGKYTVEQAIRPIAKICYFISKSPKINLTEIEKKQITVTCFDWLIGKHKVAPKVFALYTLSLYAKNDNWIRLELMDIIEKDFNEQSAAYKAASRKVLKNKK